MNASPWRFLFAASLFATTAGVSAQPLEILDSANFENLFEGDDFPSGDNYATTTGGVISETEPGIFILDHQDGGDYDGSTPAFFQGQDGYFSMTDEDGWTAEFRFRLDPNSTAPFQWQWRIGEGEAANDVGFHQIYRFGNDFLNAVGPGGGNLVASNLLPTDEDENGQIDLDEGYHTFRVAQIGSLQTGPSGQDLGDSNTYYSWLDGVPLAPTIGGYSVGAQPWWGCGSGSCGGGDAGEIRIDYFRWTGSGGFLPADFVPPPTESTWTADQLGFWTDGSNWDPDEPLTVVPNNVNPDTDTALHTAHFSSAITADRTVIADSTITLNKIVLNNANSYVFVGLGSINLASGQVEIDEMIPRTTEFHDGMIEVLGTGDTEENNLGETVGPGVAGHHEFQLPVNLLGNSEAKVGANASLTLDNALDLGGDTLTKTGAGTLYINNDQAGTEGTVDVDGGTLGGSGTIGGDLNNNDTVAPGQSAGELTVTGNYTQSSAATLAIELAGTEPIEQYDRLSAGNFSLNGTLQVTAIDGFNIGNGDSFDILDFISLSGTFNTLDLPGGQAAWDVSMLYASGLLTCVSDSCGGGFAPGDFDKNGVVDGNDFLAWQANFGTSSGATQAQGDANGDGAVDGQDFLLWQANFGSGAGGSGQAAVPEPSSLLAAALCLLATLFWRGRKMRTSIVMVPLAMILATLVGAVDARAQVYAELDSSAFPQKYEADEFNPEPPEGETPFPNYTPNSAAFSEFSHVAGGGVLFMDHTLSTVVFESDLWPTEADDAGGWTAEIRFRLDPFEEATKPQLQWRVGDAENDAANPMEIFRFTNSSVRALQGGFNLIENVDLSSDFHTLRVAQLPNDNLTVMWLDGQAIPRVTLGGFSGGLSMWFGSGSGSVGGQAQIDYLRWTGDGGFRCPGCDDITIPNQWVSNSSGAQWDDPGNWLEGSVPTGNVVFGGFLNTTGARTIIVDNTVNATSLVLNNPSSLNFAGRGSVNLDGGGGAAAIDVTVGSHQFQAVVNLNSNTNADIALDTSLSFNNTLNLNGNTLTKTGEGTLNINNRVITGGGSVVGTGGSIGGSGAIAGDLVNAGSTVSPGGDQAGGVLQIEGNYTHDANSRLMFELGGLAAGAEYDVLQITGDMQIDGGILEIATADNFSPAVGDTFQILEFGSASGAFAMIELPDGQWSTANLLVNGTVTRIPEPTSLALLVSCLAAAACRRPQPASQ